jgi:hypothetical protein
MGRIVWGLVAVVCATLVLIGAFVPAEPASAQCYVRSRRFFPLCEETRTPPFYVPTVPLFATPYQVPTLFPTLVLSTATPAPSPTQTPAIPPTPAPPLTATPAPTAPAAPPETIPADDDAAPVHSLEDGPAAAAPGV